MHSSDSATRPYIPGCDSLDVEILEANKHALLFGAVEEIMTFSVTRVETGKVGGSKRALDGVHASVDEPTI